MRPGYAAAVRLIIRRAACRRVAAVAAVLLLGAVVAECGGGDAADEGPTDQLDITCPPVPGAKTGPLKSSAHG